jgi:hypothetical protein
MEKKKEKKQRVPQLTVQEAEALGVQAYRLLTFVDAERLGFGSRYNLRRAAKRGRLSFVKLGPRSLRLRPADLEAFVRANTHLAREQAR